MEILAQSSGYFLGRWTNSWNSLDLNPGKSVQSIVGFVEKAENSLLGFLSYSVPITKMSKLQLDELFM